MRPPKVSILVPVYNVSAFIEKCAHSLFCQTFDDLEFVFVNDSTPDDSMVLLQAVIDQYPSRKEQIVIVNHPLNRGIGATRNTLLQTATGDYLMWVDSDDFVSENAVDLLYAAASQDVDVVTADSYYVYQGENQIGFRRQELPTTPKEYIEALAFRNARAALWGTLSKRSLWIDNQLEMAEGVNYGEDYYNTVRLFYVAKNMAVVHEPFYYYNQANLSSYSTGSKTEMHFQSIILLFQYLDAFFQQQNDNQQFELFLAKAKLMERGALLLHTSAKLRRKYVSLYAQEGLRYATLKLPFSGWQTYLLRLINCHRFISADVAILVAKVLRRYCRINF
jgi:glycosyltransferase involved in cell wall biosynthesis